MTKDVVATQNFWVRAALDTARRGLARVVDHRARPDIVVLLEWPDGRNRLLKDLGRYQVYDKPRRDLRPRPDASWKPQDGFAWCEPDVEPVGTIGVRRDRYEVLDCYAVTLTGARYVTPTENQPRRVLPANRANVTLAYDDELEEAKAIVGYPLTSGVQVAGRYSRDARDRERVALHRDQVQALERLNRRLENRGYVVYECGDSNFDGPRIDGLTSAWAGRRDEPQHPPQQPPQDRRRLRPGPGRARLPGRPPRAGDRPQGAHRGPQPEGGLTCSSMRTTTSPFPAWSSSR